MPYALSSMSVSVTRDGPRFRAGELPPAAAEPGSLRLLGGSSRFDQVGIAPLLIVVFRMWRAHWLWRYH